MAINIKHINQEPEVSSKEKLNNSSIKDFLTQDISFSKNYPDKKKEQFYREISLLLNAGTDIKTALELIEAETTKENDRELFEAIKNDIISGSSFSEALLKTKKFTEYEYYSIKVGEESSRVNEVLSDLAAFFKSKIEQKRKLTSTLSYPIILLLTALLMVFVLLKYMVPMFQDIFKTFNKELPEITQFVIAVSASISDYFLIIFLTLVSVIVFVIMNKKKLWFRKSSSYIVLKIPVLGELIMKIYISRFCHSMNLLITSRTPLLNSINLVKKMIVFYPMQNALEKVEYDIMHGQLLNESMRNFSIFPKKMVSLIKVAEEVNKLDAIFQNLDEQYSKELAYKSEVFGKLIEPAVIFFISIIVGFIIMAMYMPMLELNTALF